ncbi:MAG: helix-turn-helix domain-containing protein [Gaiellaceae bacterium]
MRLHLARITPSPDIPSAHGRPPRPELEQLLEDGGVESITAAYEHGYSMPAIARQLGLHPSTVSRRLESSSCTDQDLTLFRHITAGRPTAVAPAGRVRRCVGVSTLRPRRSLRLADS